jgi:GNAT superfamily N-acetyltransferase
MKILLSLLKWLLLKKHRGKKIGEQLGKAAIDYAKKKQIKIIILESNTLLLPALNLYRKLGFVEVPGYISSKYSRSNIKMELKL